MNIIRNLEQGTYLFDCTTIAFDIETDTNGQGYWENKDYGLSVVSSPTYITFYSPDDPEHIDDVFIIDYSHWKNYQEGTEFLRFLFTQDVERLWIAHNATFDFRHLGTHLGFKVPFKHNIWDTQIIALRSLICRVKNQEYSSSLENQLKMFDLVSHEDAAFLHNMKDSRAVLHTLSVEQVEKYACLDTWYTYQLYETQERIISELVESDVRGKYGRTYLAIPHWPEIKDLVKFEQRVSRWAANSAIQGVKLNQEFSEKKYEQWFKEQEEARQRVLEAQPPLPYSEFYSDLKMMIWWEHIVKYLSNQISTFKNYFLFEEWSWSEFTEDLIKYISFETASQAQGWTMEKLREFVDKFHNLPNTPINSKGIRAYLQTDLNHYPTIDVKKFICEKTGITDDYKLNVFYEWYEFLYRQRHKVPRDDYLNKMKWKPFFFFVVADVPLPTHEQIVYSFDVVSDKMNEIISWLEPYELSLDSFDERGLDHYDINELPYEIPFDYSKIAQQGGYFSISTKAINYLLPDKDDEGNIIEYEGGLKLAKDYELYLKNSAMIQRAEEFIAHTLLDGRLHTMLRRGTNTGRFMSSQPNLQNVKLRSSGDFDFIGFLRGDEGYTLVELDYSNAENKVAVIVSGDNFLAEATETGDFHRNMAMRYNNLESPDQVTKDMRTLGKKITFGTAYGMGKYKLRRELGSVDFPMLPAKAQEFLERKDTAFPQVTLVKNKSSELVEKRFKQGWVPYINTWRKSRVSISTYTRNGQEEVKAYKGWNGAIQGGVGEAIAIACVLANEWLETEGYRSRVVLNIHDSLIVHCKNEEYEEVIPKICEIMGSVIPERFCKRTIPAVHMVTAVGPENALKWGYVEGEEYPFDQSKFINQWGIHPMPEGEKEAPTWIGPEHEGWTLEAEIEEQKESMYVSSSQKMS